MSKPKAPKAPDPKETAAAQTATNIGTALANSVFGNVNQVTPDGTLTYTQEGTYDWTDPNSGKVYQLPKTTATQTLSEQQQAIKDQQDAANLNLGKLANTQSAFLNNYMAQPFSLNNDAVEGRLNELARKRLDPLQAQQSETFKTELANRGIKMGTPQYDEQMMKLAQRQNDANNQLILSGHQQATQDLLTERNQPLNEISALLSGSQVEQPNWVSTDMPTIQTTDIAGLTQQDYQNQLAKYQQKMGSYNGMMGGLFSLAGSGSKFAMGA